ncbi:glycosyltransferase family 2 protein [Marinilactibacillus piezotolerans]|uniref:glycosyltransferase family 2 protein n=1 Tax=Marinilactibacillus piezotolerans TaxID=258723 RepID=UPI0009AF5471|nr:glycosyltransferase family 2 protein [Marinilactibacillus piezotolerans]
MQDTLISIVTPVYKAEKYILETIQSVQNQTYKNFEMILVDDCSPDNSAEIIKEIASTDQRIKYIKLKKNSGAAVARNKGIETAQGRYIAFLDSDDKWYSTKLEKQIGFMKQNNIAFSYTKFELINNDGTLRKKAADLPKKLNYYGLLKNTAIACSTVILDRKIIGDFRMPLVRKGQDTATWLKILRDIDYAYLLNETLNQYRAVDGSLSSNKVQAIKRTWNTYRNLEKLPLPLAVYFLSRSLINAFLRRV